jgi:hypothetical protein
MNIRMITLQSIGSIFDILTKELYPIFQDGTIDFDNPTHITEVVYDGINHISKFDIEQLRTFNVNLTFNSEVKVELI